MTWRPRAGGRRHIAAENRDEAYQYDVQADGGRYLFSAVRHGTYSGDASAPGRPRRGESDSSLPSDRTTRHILRQETSGVIDTIVDGLWRHHDCSMRRRRGHNGPRNTDLDASRTTG